ncbi:YciI family protein [Bordetella genomosp. 12]|uniref:YCII-related domain-containing protein n=1 Tax=Bordetella genomosp. 12 TaxID=463035 RepID=A0A261VBX8_9BORD|nr:YciI family protein [Bordetella genomosp. 12]OZI71654.1 hypothetical protein CAL22_17795 [Bordetella genomosp. 12]
MQFIVLCRMRDPLDAETQRKRLELRPAHIERAAKFQAMGKLLIGGMIKDTHENPAGSGAIWNVDSLQELEGILADDPWRVSGVWHDIEIVPFRVAEHFLNH